jgi:hypothetical protein
VPTSGATGSPPSWVAAAEPGAPAIEPALPQSARQSGELLAAALRDGLDLAKHLIRDPVEGAPAFFRARHGRAGETIGASAALLAAAALVGALGFNIGSREWLGGLAGPLLGFEGGRGALLGVLAGVAILASCGLALGAGMHGLRRAILRSTTLAPDLLVAAATMMPVMAVVLLAGFLGPGNLEVAVIALFVGFVISNLVLFTGLRELGGLSARVSVVAVPALLLAVAWFAKVVLVIVG